MADLRDVVSALLRDVTEARSQADKAVRDLALEYRNDAILRAFPVPRTEIRDLKIELRVAVTDLGQGSDAASRREKIIRVHVDRSLKALGLDDSIARKLVDVALRDAAPSAERIEQMLTDAVRASVRELTGTLDIEVYRDFLVVSESKDGNTRIVPFLSSESVPVKRFASPVEARKGIDAISKLRAGTALTPQQRKQADEAIRVERESFEKRLLSEKLSLVKTTALDLATTVAGIKEQPEDKRLTVDVSTEQLKALPQHMISTLTFTLDVDGILPASFEES